MDVPLKMVIVHCYVSSPEGIGDDQKAQKNNSSTNGAPGPGRSNFHGSHVGSPAWLKVGTPKQSEIHCALGDGIA